MKGGALYWAEGLPNNPICLHFSSHYLRAEEVSPTDKPAADLSGGHKHLLSPSVLSFFLLPVSPFSLSRTCFLPILISFLNSLQPLSLILLRFAKFYQNPRGPDRHLGGSCIICVPGQWGAQTQDHLDEERQESQLPAL